MVPTNELLMLFWCNNDHEEKVWDDCCDPHLCQQSSFFSCFNVHWHSTLSKRKLWRCNRCWFNKRIKRETNTFPVFVQMFLIHHNTEVWEIDRETLKFNKRCSNNLSRCFWAEEESHVADVVCHHVCVFPSFVQDNTEWAEPAQCSVPCVGVSIPWVSPEVKGQDMRGTTST